MSSYKTARALEMAIKEAAKASTLDTNRAIANFYFHRFLCRVFSDSVESFVLKGGLGMLARTANARYTRDIDLTTSSLDIESAIEELKALAKKDLHDFVSFAYAGCEQIKAEDEYRNGYAVTFDAYLGAKKVQTISIDLVCDQIICETYDILAPVDRIDVKGLTICDYRIYPSERAVADKICGIIEQHDGRPSSRVKDLVDIVIYASTESFAADTLIASIAREFSARRIPSIQAFNIPPEWEESQERRYAKTVNGLPLSAIASTMHEAESFCKAFLDPVLSGAIVDGTWQCDDKTWRK